MEEEKKDYGKTLNLPKTDFPMRASLAENEPKIQEEVFDNGLYEKSLKKNKGNDKFVLHDGPPYANGEIHIGHALNKIVKDTINRYKMLRGYETLFVPGYDTHGLPTERKAIQELGLNRDEVSVNDFRDKCKEFAEKFVGIQTEGFKRLGVLADWNHPYITYQPELEARQVEVFGEMYKKGYIYKGLKPVYWCTDCETALAEAEIEYKDVDTTSIYVKFAVEDSKGLFDKKDTYFVIWTTTPWTLPANTGICIGADFDYAFVKVGKETLIIAEARVDEVMKESGIEDYEVLKTIKGSELEGVLCMHPFMNRTSKVVLGSDDTILVELDTGTGAVHTAPSYGKEDYLCGIKNDLGLFVYIDDKGYQTEETGVFAGLKYDESNDAIIKWLEENKFLLHKETLNHSYPHCWRCKNPIIFRATDQWFCSVDKFKNQTLKAIEKVEWLPKWGEDRIASMVKERADWCISRQRTWGVPLPIFYCKECKKEYITEESIKKISEIFRKEGSNAWYGKEVEELLPKGAKCECGCTEFTKEKDIMDVWFDSGSTHQGVLVERGLPYPADLYLEGADQYRGWFQSSILTSVAMNGIAPYKQVLTHGWTVDGEGRVMHKSLGNGISPQEVIGQYGADILRLWVIASDYQSDVRLSKDILKQITEVYRKIRNTARYILGNTSDFDPDKDEVKYEELEEIDRWALMRLNKLVKEFTEDYEEYDFHDAYQALNAFCVVDMSNFYLDIIKDRLYTYKKESKERRSAQTAMYKILDAIVKMLAPMASFTAEEIWKYMIHTKKESVESVMLSDWPEVDEKYDDKELEEKWNKIIELKTDVAKALEEARANKVIGHSLNAKVTLYVNEDNKNYYELIKNNLELLQTVFIVSGLEIEDNKRKSEGNKVGIEVKVADGEKCERCWMYSTTVGEDKENPTICHRCSEHLK